MSTFDKQVNAYADALDENVEDVRTLFEVCCETCYEGNLDMFLEDLANGVVVTQDGPVSVRAYVDDQLENEMWGG